MRSVALPFAMLLLGLAGCGGSDPDGASAGTAYFVDITDQVSLDFTHGFGPTGTYYYPEIMGSGGGFLDYDADGLLDVYVVNGSARRNGGPDPLRNRLFRQQDDGTFVDVTAASGTGDTGFGMGLAVGDIDNDGDVDLYVANVGRDVLFRNEGDGTFTDVTRAAGIANHQWGSSVTLLDFDRDGWLDVYVANYVSVDTMIVCTDLTGRQDYCGPPFYIGVPDVLYRNNGDGTFRDVSERAGIARVAAAGLGVVSLDVTGDDYLDVYVANDGEPNQLWINQQDGTFRDEALRFGAAVNAMGRSEAGMGIAVGDTDNDGDFDLLLTHLREESNTYLRRGPVAFEDETLGAGLAGPSIPYTEFGTGFVDYDNDGDVDLLSVSGRVLGGPLLGASGDGFWRPYEEPNLVFENDGAGRFRNVSEREPAFAGTIANSRALAFGDIDNDGDLDLLITRGGGRARLLRNDAGRSGHWLVVRAIDPRWQRDALGATVVVVAGARRFRRLIATSYSYQSSHDPRAHFGLGDATRVDSVVVRWPDGMEEAFDGVAADQFITVERGGGGGGEGGRVTSG